MDKNISWLDENKIQSLLSRPKPDKKEIEEILSFSLSQKGLSLEQTATLLFIEDPEQLEMLYETAGKIKEKIYGNRLVFFAPLYVTNECHNQCLYCGFSANNKDLKRKTLNLEELKEEVRILEKMGHKRLLLVYGESQNIDYLVETVKTVYATKEGRGEIRRININSAPLTVEEFRLLKQTGIGTYQCFQETYHRQTYEKMHIGGKKADYFWRINAFDRAMAAGIDDVGAGALFGLYDWKFEVLGLLSHAFHLEKEFGVGPHTISVPRIEPALNAPVSTHPPYPVSDADFKKLVAILRIAVPYTGIILTTRENPAFRKELLLCGVSQISAASKTYPGGYKASLSHQPDLEQFTLGDTRSLDEVIYDALSMGFIPSFCTACYRMGRTGHDFMDLAKPGEIHSFCTPNAILTFLEYLLDYASPKTKEAGFIFLEKEKTKLDSSTLSIVEQYIERIKKGERDLFF